MSHVAFYMDFPGGSTQKSKLAESSRYREMVKNWWFRVVEIFGDRCFEASINSDTRFRISKITFIGMKILVPWIFMKSKLLSQSFVAFANISSASSSFICANNTFLSSVCIFNKIRWVSDFFTAAFSVMCDTFKVQNLYVKINSANWLQCR